MLKHCAANRKRRLSALPNVCPYIYMTLKFLALQGAPYIYDISRARVKERRGYSHLKEEALDRTVWRAGFGRGFGPVVRQTAK
jgi:hypothetical protein